MGMKICEKSTRLGKFGQQMIVVKERQNFEFRLKNVQIKVRPILESDKTRETNVAGKNKTDLNDVKGTLTV